MHSFSSIAALKRYSLVPRLLLLPLLAFTAFATSQPSTVNATIDTTTGASSSQSTERGLRVQENCGRMAPDSIDAMVQVDKKPELRVEEQSLGALPDTITVRPFSVNIYSYPVQ